MSKSIKYIRLVGVNDKEAILIRSFLSVARDDGFNVDIDETESHIPKVVIVDELFHSDTLVDDFPGATVLIIGDDIHYHSDDYMARPLKWSAFQSALEECIQKSSGDVLGIIDDSDDDGTSLLGRDVTQLYEAESDTEEGDSYSRSLATQMASYLDDSSYSSSEQSSTSYSEVGTVMHK